MFNFIETPDMFYPNEVNLAHRFQWERRATCFGRIKQNNIDAVKQAKALMLLKNLLADMLKSRNAQLNHSISQRYQSLKTLEKINNQLQTIYSISNLKLYCEQLSARVLPLMDSLRHHPESRFKLWNSQLDMIQAFCNSFSNCEVTTQQKLALSE